MRVSRTTAIEYLKPAKSLEQRASSAERDGGGAGTPAASVSLSAEVYLRYLERAVLDAMAPELRGLLNHPELDLSQPGDDPHPAPVAARLLRELRLGFHDYRAQREHLTETEALGAYRLEARRAVERAFTQVLQALRERNVLGEVSQPAEELLTRVLDGIEALGRAAA